VRRRSGRHERFRPADYQPPFPLERTVLEEAPSPDAVELDVLFVGGGVAGLAGAIELARLARSHAGGTGTAPSLEIGVLEKADRLGAHCLSGAVVNPVSLRELFPEVPLEAFPFRRKVERERVYLLTERSRLRIPTPPPMRNRGFYVASVCELVRWLGEKAEALGVNLFTGFPAEALLVEGRRVVGVRTAPSGLGRDGRPGPDFTPPTDLVAKVTVLAEGTRGLLAQAFFHWQGIRAPNEQIYALGVKEIWQTRRVPDGAIHTLGWPLPRDTFGGSFVYPMADDLVAVGLVVGLDYRASDLDAHVLLQRLKTHPMFREILDGGRLLEWGAKTIPEGGFWSLPERLHGDGLLVTGDAAGFVNVAALKGIHYAIESGILAARVVYDALASSDVSSAALGRYDEAVRRSFIVRDLWRTRNMRLAFKKGLVWGGLRAAVMAGTGGALFGGRIPVGSDAREDRVVRLRDDFKPDGKLTFSKVDAVFHSGNRTRDSIPSHLLVGKDIPPAVAAFYEHLCPAGVYEVEGERLVVHAPNCVDCKATDVLGPRWTPRERGSGPDYKLM
jgi:electron-transferring-flavoprotein dehydrogenase